MYILFASIFIRGVNICVVPLCFAVFQTLVNEQAAKSELLCRFIDIFRQFYTAGLKNKHAVATSSISINVRTLRHLVRWKPKLLRTGYQLCGLTNRMPPLQLLPTDQNSQTGEEDRAVK